MYNWSARKEVAEKVAAKYAAKAVLQGKFIAFNPYIRKKRSQINDFSFLFKKLRGKIEQIRPM